MTAASFDCSGHMRRILEPACDLVAKPDCLAPGMIDRNLILSGMITCRHGRHH
jgi:hypothetical protein